jgi:hypothetical protein
MEPAIKDAFIRLNERIKQLEDQIKNAKDTQYPERSEQINELVAALAKAQASMAVAGKSASGYNFKYADIEEVIKASRPSLTENELVIMQMVQSTNKDEDYLYTVLSHSSGQWISSRVRIKPDKEGNQGFGAAITYVRRYAYVSIIGLSVANENDIDNYRK